jgi:hypothetical protein
MDIREDPGDLGLSYLSLASTIFWQYSRTGSNPTDLVYSRLMGIMDTGYTLQLILFIDFRPIKFVYW